MEPNSPLMEMRSGDISPEPTTATRGTCLAASWGSVVAYRDRLHDGRRRNGLAPGNLTRACLHHELSLKVGELKKNPTTYALQ
jgi:hypothetical protein